MCDWGCGWMHGCVYDLLVNIRTLCEAASVLVKEERSSIRAAMLGRRKGCLCRLEEGEGIVYVCVLGVFV